MVQISHPYDYASTYRQALQVNWQIDAIIGGDKRLDFRTTFLPDAWVDATALDFLSTAEQLTVNHIRSHSYLSLFGLVEEYIVPFVVEHVRTRLHRAAQAELRALLHFAEEESKHIELFQRFGAEFRAGFDFPCEVIGPPAAVAEQILRKSPLGVALSILHIEWMTQLHYVASVKDNHDLDAQFCSLLRHHWLEEAQHAKLDTLIVAALAQQLSTTEIEAGIDDYLDIGGLFDEALQLPDSTFDVALCALGLMYIPDPIQALQEMHRVLKPGGRAGAAVWGQRDRCDWAAIFPIVEARVQSEVCPLFFQLGIQETLGQAFEAAGFKDVESERLSTMLHYETPEDACGAAFAGEPVALAYSRFDAHTRQAAHAEYLATIAPYRNGNGYAIPGEFVIACGRQR